MPLPEMNEEEKRRMKEVEEKFNQLLDRYNAELIFQKIETMGPTGEVKEMNIYFFPRRKVAVAAA